MIPYSKQLIESDDIESVVEALKSSHLTQGERALVFQSDLAKYCGCKYAATLNSATSALLSLYRAFGLQEGDEVITTPITFMATSNMLIEVGAKPIFCDIKSDGNIDEEKIEKLITKKTKMVVSVDFGGNPVEYDKISKICKKEGLKFISDASHSLGALYHGESVARFADATVFSFHAIKPITTGEGGAVVSDEKDIIDFVKRFASHGVVKKRLWNSDMSEYGFNFRLTDISCALGISQLKKLDSFIEKRESIANIYEQKFSSLPYFDTIKIDTSKRSSRHLYPIKLKERYWCAKEDIFEEFLKAGVGVQVHYKPLYKFSFYKRLYGDIFLKNTEEFYNAELSLPIFQSMSQEDVLFVVESCEKIFDKFSRRDGCYL